MAKNDCWCWMETNISTKTRKPSPPTKEDILLGCGCWTIILVCLIGIPLSLIGLGIIISNLFK